MRSSAVRCLRPWTDEHDDRVDDHGGPAAVAYEHMRRHRTAVCTIATGPHEQLYEISGPSFERYAEHNGYDLIVAHHDLGGDRHAAWGKLALLREMLDCYDRVVWVDADAVIVDPSGNIFEGADRLRQCWLVVHRYGGLEIPNMGVVAMISTRWTKRFVERLWMQEQHIEHKWWDNAATIELLGYDLESPQQRVATAHRHVLPRRRTRSVVEQHRPRPLASTSDRPLSRHEPGRQVDRDAADSGPCRCGLRSARKCSTCGRRPRRGPSGARPAVAAGCPMTEAEERDRSIVRYSRRGRCAEFVPNSPVMKAAAPRVDAIMIR